MYNIHVNVNIALVDRTLSRVCKSSSQEKL